MLRWYFILTCKSKLSTFEFYLIISNTIKTEFTSQQAVKCRVCSLQWNTKHIRKQKMSILIQRTPIPTFALTSLPPVHPMPPAPFLPPGCAAAKACSPPLHTVCRKWTCSPLWPAAIQSGGWSVQIPCRVHNDKKNGNKNTTNSYSNG